MIPLVSRVCSPIRSRRRSPSRGVAATRVVARVPLRPSRGGFEALDRTSKLVRRAVSGSTPAGSVRDRLPVGCGDNSERTSSTSMRISSRTYRAVCSSPRRSSRAPMAVSRLCIRDLTRATRGSVRASGRVSSTDSRGIESVRDSRLDSSSATSASIGVPARASTPSTRDRPSRSSSSRRRE